MDRRRLWSATKWIGMLVLVGAWAANDALGTELAFLQIAQPIYNPEEESVKLYRFTFAEWIGSAQPGVEIRYTCKPNCVPVPGDSVPRNYNVANLLGFSVQVEDHDERTWKVRPPSRRWPKGATVVDTLRVTLDVSTVGLRGREFAQKLAQETGVDIDGVSPTRAVDVTIECILDNARQSVPAIEYIRLDVVGDTAFAGRSGVRRIGAPRR